MKLAATQKLNKSDLPYDFGHILNHAKRVLDNPILPAVEKELRKIAKAYMEKLRQYGHASQNGKHEKARKFEHFLCTAAGSKIVSVILGYPKNSPKISWTEVKELAKFVNPKNASNEPVVVKEIPKAEGGKRPIVVFGKITGANQSLVRDMFAARHGPSKKEYARKGRGREKLILEIDNQNRNGGVRALGLADIKDCFLSIGLECVLNKSGMSKAIIQNTTFISDQTSVHMKAYDISESAVRAGLPQGSLSSPIVASKIIESCLDKISTRMALSYLDDITIGEKSVEEVQATLDALAYALKHEHPGSPFFLKYSKAIKIGERADLLGCWVRTNLKEFGGGIRVTPSEKAIRRFYVKVAIELLQHPYEEWEEMLENRAYAWAKSFPLWKGALGGTEFLQSVFIGEISGGLWAANHKVLSCIEFGFPKEKITAMAASYANSIVPDCVLVDVNGFCDPLND